jgi:hypothetical protein
MNWPVKASAARLGQSGGLWCIILSMLRGILIKAIP